MKRFALLMALLLALPVAASDIIVTWDPSVGATSYNVYLGTAPGTYPLISPSPTSPYTFPDSAMFPNIRNYLAVSALNAAGESGLSQEINGFPRPTIVSALPTDQGGFFRVTVMGTNFSDGLALANVNFVGMTVLSVTRISAMELWIDYTIDPGTNGDVDLVVSNDWQGAGLANMDVPSVVFLVPSMVPDPPVIIGVD